MSLDLDAIQMKPKLRQLYYDSLIHFLELFQFIGEKPKYEVLMEDYNQAHCYGIASAIVSRPITMVSLDNIPDMEEISKNWLENKEVKFSAYENKEELFLKIIQFSLKEASELGVL